MLFVSFHSYSAYQLESVVYEQESDPEQAYIESNDSISSIDSESIKQMNASSVDDIMRASSAATTSRGPRSSGEAIQVRGLDSNKIFISIDGVRQNFRSGHTSSVNVDLENLKTVDIYTDSSDLSKGASLGGGVNFVTKDAEDYLYGKNTHGAEFLYQNNSANNENIYNAKTVFKNKDISGIFSLTSAESQNIILNDGTELQNSSYKDFKSLVKLEYDKVKITYQYFKRIDDSPLDSSLDPPERIQSLQADSERIKNDVNVEFKNSYVFGNLFYTNYQEHKKRRSDKRKDSRVIDTLGLNLKRRSKQWTYGLEAYEDRLSGDADGQQIVSYPEANSFTGNIFAQKEYGVRDFKVVPGVRYSFYKMDASEKEFDSKSGSQLSKKVSINYKPNQKVDITAAYSEGFNAPRVNEVYPKGLHAKGDNFFIRDNYFIQNLNLKHETSQIVELRTKFHLLNKYDESLILSASGYENRVRDYIGMERIDRSVIDQSDGTTQFINISRVKLFGSQVKLHYMYGAFDLSLAYEQVRGRNLKDNLYLEDLPADQYVYDFKYYMDKYGMSFGYLGIKALKQNRVNPETIQRTDPTPDYFIHNVFATKTIGRNWNLNLRIDNLGNTKYRKHGSHLYESREDVKISFKYKINTI